MTELRRIVSRQGRFRLIVTAAPPLPLAPDYGQHRIVTSVAPGVPCRARPAFQYHGRIVWQTGGPSLFADVTASYYPLDSPTLTIAIAANFFDGEEKNGSPAWARVLASATFAGAEALVEKHPPLCGGALYYTHGRYHPVDSNQLAYYRLGRVIAYTALADHRNLTDAQIAGALQQV